MPNSSQDSVRKSDDFEPEAGPLEPEAGPLEPEAGPRWLRRYFELVADHPRLALAAVGMIVLCSAYPVRWIHWNNRPDAFIPEDHPALLAKQQVERQFGLEDPMLLALSTGRPGGLYSGAPLLLLKSLTERLQKELAPYLGGEESRQSIAISSLANEFDVEMNGDIPIELPFLEPFPKSAEEFARLEKRILDLELYTGALVSEDGSAAAIIVIPAPEHVEKVFHQVSVIVQETEAVAGAAGVALHLAGEAAVRSAMGHSVALDGFRLNPVCMAVMAIILFLTFRSFTGVFLPFTVVGAACTIMLGLLCLSGQPIYIITNAIAVTVIALGVADSVHILGQFYEEFRLHGTRGRRDLVVSANLRMFAPVLYTSLTDMGGFLAFLATGIMTPLKAFGLFAAVGSGASLFLSLTVIPAYLMIARPSQAPRERLRDWSAAGPMVRWLTRFGDGILRHPRAVTFIALIATGLLFAGAFQLRANQSMASAFEETHPIVQADRAINRDFHGTYFLDVLIEGEKPGDLIQPEALRAVDRLEEFAKTLPNVGGTFSYAGFTKKIHQIFNGGGRAHYRIPDDAGTVRQNFELLKSSPTKLAHLHRSLDPAFQTGVVRIRSKSGRTVDERPLAEAVESYLRESFRFQGLKSAKLAGRVNVDRLWLDLIIQSNIGSVAVSLLITLISMIVLARSLTGGLFGLLPVGIAVLSTYGLMGWSGIDFGIGTSMFASIAIGVGINFPIHVLDRLRVALGEEKKSEAAAFGEVYRLTAKALLSNAATIAAGFLALLISELPLMRHFGIMIAASIATSCLFSLTMLPALCWWLKPKFLYRSFQRPRIEAPVSG